MAASVIAQLMDLIECPICLKTPEDSTEILQCQKGHWYCAECYEKLTACSICRVPLGQVRITCLLAKKSISILRSNNNNQPTQQQPQQVVRTKRGKS